MPIVIKNFIWSQTDSKIIIKVPMKGVIQSKTDIFNSPQYIKASFQQYFFEVILFDCIDDNHTICTFMNDLIIFDLTKIENKQWEFLEINLPKPEKNILRKQLIEEEHKRFQDKCKERNVKQSELKRVAVSEQIELDSRNRALIDKIRKDEETKALGDLNEWKEELVKTKIKTNKKITPTLQPKCKKQIEIPLPRSTRSLQVIFTHRDFPTPIRESKLEEENEWLKKQAEARRSAGFIREDIRPEERNPQFLKSKGDEFLRNKNYLGALSAYSFGIEISKKFVDLYIARSEAHLAIGNLNKAVEDCSEALSLMKPAVPQNIKERALCIGRRGVCLHKLGLKKQGISELKFSLKLVPSEEFELYLQEAQEKDEEEAKQQAKEETDLKINQESKQDTKNEKTEEIIGTEVKKVCDVKKVETVVTEEVNENNEKL